MASITSFDHYRDAWQQAQAQPETFWADYARSFRWKQPWKTVVESDFHAPSIRWFDGATLNITENCLDRWAEATPDQPAFIWEPSHPDDAPLVLSYRELLEKVTQLAATLRGLGVQKGDRVCIYMPMVPELAIGVLACARVGAVHSVIFGGFSPRSVSDRITDASARLVLTATGSLRGEKPVLLKKIMDEALAECPGVEKVLVLDCPAVPAALMPGRDIDWAQAVGAADPAQGYAEEMSAEDMLFILYTSGSTGKPKGVVHTTAGYMVWTHFTFSNVFQYRPGDVFFCTADVGWITGHSYLLYGSLLNGATTLMFEGVPTWPDAGRFWQIIDRHKVNIFYTAPTAIRSLMTAHDIHLADYDFSSLRVLGSVGEPINEEAWYWYHKNIGRGRCPIVDTWWQTETGGILISALAGVTPSIPAFATLPMPGVEPLLVDEKGNEISGNPAEGNLCLRGSWPGMMRTTYGDHDRFRQTYFSTYPGLYFTGDGAQRDADGNYRITGRVDDVINVSGHRIGTAEVESAINATPGVAESAVVGRPHDIKGQGLYAYVVYSEEPHDHSLAIQQIIRTVSEQIGPIAKPDWIQFVPGLPKTRSGKIMRRILRKIAEGDLGNMGDTSTLLDPGVVDHIAQHRVH